MQLNPLDQIWKCRRPVWFRVMSSQVLSEYGSSWAGPPPFTDSVLVDYQQIRFIQLLEMGIRVGPVRTRWLGSGWSDDPKFRCFMIWDRADSIITVRVPIRIWTENSIIFPLSVLFFRIWIESGPDSKKFEDVTREPDRTRNIMVRIWTDSKNSGPSLICTTLTAATELNYHWHKLINKPFLL